MTLLGVAIMAACAGLAVGIPAGLVGGEALLARTLRLKADPQHRTAARLGGEFFYIVPEGEYVACRRSFDHA